MTRKRLLLSAVIFLTTICVVVAGGILVRSLAVTDATDASQEVRVALADIAPGQLSRVTWRGVNIVLLVDDAPRAFVIPYDAKNGTYLMPDLTWDRAYIPCTKLTLSGGEIRCRDPDLWGDAFAWRTNGSNISGRVAALQEPPFFIQGDFLILGRQRDR